MKRVFSLPVLVLVALVALVLGSVGTAVAGQALTKSQVKKIATKVVKKKGPKLTVSNANALAGLPASAYRDNVTVYSTTFTDPRPAVSIAVPLAPGTYHLSYSAYLDGASAGNCYFRQYQGTTEILNIGDDYGHEGVSGSAVVTVAAGQVVKLYCSADANFTTYSTSGVTDPIQIVVTPLDSVTARSLPAARSRVASRD